MFKRLLYFFSLALFILNSHRSKAVLCTTLASGNWTNPAVWSCGSVPGCGDSIVIQAAHTISITTQQNYTNCAQPLKFSVFGVLFFETGNKLKLPCNSILMVANSGSIVPGNGGGNSNLIEICNNIVWNAGDGTIPGPACLPPVDPCGAGVLPVELLSFSANEVKEGIHLMWETQTEKNSNRFELERSHDALDFNHILSHLTKAPGGNSSQRNEYELIDVSPLSPVNYYRLKLVDNDNTFTYSKIVSAAFDSKSAVRFIIYPNPNKGEFTADISGIENNHSIRIVLHDEKGSVVYQSGFYIQDSHSTKINIIPEAKLRSGIYTCTLMLEEIAYHVKVVVD